jgi:hypothetical protein
LDAEHHRAELAKCIYPFLLWFLLTPVQENTQKVHAIITETQLEVEPDYKDSMHNFNESTSMHDDNDNEYQDNEDDTPLFSQFLQMTIQER